MLPQNSGLSSHSPIFSRVECVVDLDVAEVLDFKILCVRREGACSEREESSSLLHAPKFLERTHGDQHLEGLNARRFWDLAS